MDLRQAEDRVHRICQKRDVEIYYLLFDHDDSVDNVIFNNIISRDIKTANSVLNKQEDISFTLPDQILNINANNASHMDEQLISSFAP